MGHPTYRGATYRFEKCKDVGLNRLAERGGFEPPVEVLAPTTV
jgi:hypothetical protein